jgi:hypothetical protein
VLLAIPAFFDKVGKLNQFLRAAGNFPFWTCCEAPDRGKSLAAFRTINPGFPLAATGWLEEMYAAKVFFSVHRGS